MISDFKQSCLFIESNKNHATYKRKVINPRGCIETIKRQEPGFHTAYKVFYEKPIKKKMLIGFRHIEKQTFWHPKTHKIKVKKYF